MGTRAPVLIWSPSAAPLAAAAREAGWDAIISGNEADARGVVALVDARGGVSDAATVLAGWGAAALRVALVGDGDPAVQDRLIDAGATQVALVGAASTGLAQALRLAGLALARADRRERGGQGSAALEAWVAGRLDAGEPVAAIHVGLVRLDLVNAAHGRDRGTALIEAAERRVAAQIAAVAEDDGMVARIAGPGFVAAIAGPPERAVIAAVRIEEALARPFRLRGDTGEGAVLGSRIGLTGGRPGEDAAALLARAAAALGEVVAPAVDDPLAVDIHRALAGDEIAIVFQPQATMADGAIVAVEALARWRHPTRGGLGAEALLAAAARAGIGVALSDHIQRRVLDEMAAWPPCLAGLRVALNLTAADIARHGFAETLLGHVDARGIARERLTFEVTETELMTDLDAAAAVLAALQDGGCRTAIDDFGTGYSSLAYLAALPIDYLKLDRTLAQEIVGARRGQVVVRAAIDMARSLGIAVVAEGVETEEQRDALATAGCALYQGFLLAEPIDGRGLATLMEDA